MSPCFTPRPRAKPGRAQVAGQCPAGSRHKSVVLLPPLPSCPQMCPLFPQQTGWLCRASATDVQEAAVAATVHHYPPPAAHYPLSAHSPLAAHLPRPRGCFWRQHGLCSMGAQAVCWHRSWPGRAVSGRRTDETLGAPSEAGSEQRVVPGVLCIMDEALRAGAERWRDSDALYNAG